MYARSTGFSQQRAAPAATATASVPVAVPTPAPASVLRPIADDTHRTPCAHAMYVAPPPCSSAAAVPQGAVASIHNDAKLLAMSAKKLASSQSRRYTVTAAAQGTTCLAAPRVQPRQQQQQQDQPQRHAFAVSQHSDNFVADPAALDTILNHEGVTDATHAVPLTRATLGGSYTRDEYRTKASSIFHGALRVRRRATRAGVPVPASPSTPSLARLVPTTPRTGGRGLALAGRSTARPATASAAAWTAGMPRRYTMSSSAAGAASETLRSPQVTHFSSRDQHHTQTHALPTGGSVLAWTAHAPAASGAATAARLAMAEAAPERAPASQDSLEAMPASQNPLEALPASQDSLQTMAMLEVILQREAELERELQAEIARESARLDRTTQEQSATVASVATPTALMVKPSVAATRAVACKPEATVVPAGAAAPSVTATAVASPMPPLVLAAPVAQLAVRSPPGHKLNPTKITAMNTTTAITPARCVVAPRAVRPGPPVAEALLVLRSDQPDDELSAAFVHAVGRGIMANAAQMLAMRHLDHPLAEHLHAADEARLAAEARAELPPPPCDSPHRFRPLCPVALSR